MYNFVWLGLEMLSLFICHDRYKLINDTIYVSIICIEKIKNNYITIINTFFVKYFIIILVGTCLTNISQL